MGGSPITNVLVYTYNCYSPLMSSIGLKIIIGDSPKKFFEVYTPSRGSPQIIYEGLHILWWFGSWKILGLLTWWLTKKQRNNLTSTGGSPTNNVLVYPKNGVLY